jgi:hypothetical protein
VTPLLPVLGSHHDKEKTIVTHHRTLLVAGVAAALLAACSGGTSSSGANGALTTTQSAVALQIDTSHLQSSGRSTQFIGASADTVGYSFTPGPITGTLVLNSCPHAGTPTSYTCTIGLPPNTYSLALTLQKGATVIGNGSATGIAIAPSTTTAASISVNPINSAVTMAINALQPTQFYTDNFATPQTITTTVNELDPVGDIATTFYGPVSNYPTLAFSATAGGTGVTLPASISTPPSAQAGNTAINVQYNGAGVNASSLGLKVSDGTTNASLTIPFITIAPSAASVSITTVGGNTTATITESATSAATIDAKFDSSTNCTTHATFSPTLGTGTSGNGTSPTTTSGAVTYTITAVDDTIASCTMTIASQQDSHLATTVTINFPGNSGVHITSKAR